MSFNSILVLFILLICIFLILQILSIKLSTLFGFLLRGSLGVIGINVVNSLIAFSSIYVGVNFFTFIFTALLGLPGFLTLYFLQAVI